MDRKVRQKAFSLKKRRPDGCLDHCLTGDARDMNAISKAKDKRLRKQLRDSLDHKATTRAAALAMIRANRLDRNTAIGAYLTARYWVAHSLKNLANTAVVNSATRWYCPGPLDEAGRLGLGA